MNLYEFAEEINKCPYFDKEAGDFLKQQALEMEKLKEKIINLSFDLEYEKLRSSKLGDILIGGHPLDDDAILKIANGQLDCVDEEYIKRFAKSIEKAHGIE